MTMKKIIVTYIAFMLPVLMWAQGYSNADKAAINGRIDTLLQNYLQKSGLTLPGVSKRNDKVVADLRAMIKTDAEIFDDINAAYNEKTHQYELKTKSRNTFIEDLVDRFPKGLLITNNNMNISYRDFDKNEIQVALSRTVQGTSSDKFTFYNEDTLLLTIGILPDQTVKIINISSIGSHLKCMNDKDNDGVIDETDECPEELGVIALNGCADADEDGIPDKRDHCPREKGTENNDGCPPSTFAYKLVFSGGIGTVFNSNKLESEMPVSALKGYDDLNEEQSQLGGIVTPSQRKASVHYHANVGYYFGKTSNKTKGISLGVSFSHYSASYNVGGLKFFYRKNQPGTQDNYHQIDLLSAAAVEEVDFSLLNFPLMFRYKTKFSQKLAAELSAGPSLKNLTAFAIGK